MFDCGDTNQNCLWFKNFCFPINRSWERGATGFPILFLLRDGTTLKSKLTAATQIRTFLFITKKKSLVQHEVDDNAEEDLKDFFVTGEIEREREILPVRSGKDHQQREYQQQIFPGWRDFLRERSPAPPSPTCWNRRHTCTSLYLCLLTKSC